MVCGHCLRYCWVRRYSITITRVARLRVILRNSSTKDKYASLAINHFCKKCEMSCFSSLLSKCESRPPPLLPVTSLATPNNQPCDRISTRKPVMRLQATSFLDHLHTKSHCSIVLGWHIYIQVVINYYSHYLVLIQFVQIKRSAGLVSLTVVTFLHSIITQWHQGNFLSQCSVRYTGPIGGHART